MIIRARMKCTKKICYEGLQEITLGAVYSEDKTSPNYSFSQATPSANMTMSVTNPSAYNQFEAGKIYDIVFSEYVEPKTEV